MLKALYTDMKTNVNCVVCPKCNDEIYSRANHDFHYCSCGEIAVDGGLNYLRLAYKSIKPEVVVREIDASREELYQDWNYRQNKFGVIKPLTKTVKPSKVKTEFGNGTNINTNNKKKDTIMPEKKTTKKTAKAKTPKVTTPVETVSEPEKGASVRVRCSGL